MRLLRPAIILFVALTLLTGVVYPLLVTGVARVLFPHQATGSLIGRDGRQAAPAADGSSGAVASALVGQEFAEGPAAPRFFWGRPSATSPRPYTAFDAEHLTGSSGSNLAPSNPALVDGVRARVEALAAADAAVGHVRPPGDRPPIDLVTASGSGLDPHVSPAAAEYQVPRVAKARGMEENDLRELVRRHSQGRWLGVFGEPVVNVVTLNLELESRAP